MKKGKIILLIVFGLVVLIGGAYIAYDELRAHFAPQQLEAESAAGEASQEVQEAETSEAPSLAPDFTVYDAQGNAVQLSDYWGTPIVLNFWASWCKPCQSEMPYFQEKADELSGEVQFLMVNMTDGVQETMDSAQAFVEEHGYTFPVLFDTEGEAGMIYGAYSLPTTFFLDADGYVIARAVGALEMEILEQGLSMITS